MFNFKININSKPILEKRNLNKFVKVGYDTEDYYPNGKSVADIAKIQNFGSFSKNIPARPFFTDTVARQKATWQRTLIEGKFSDEAFQEVGRQMVLDIQSKILSFVPPSNAPATIKQKKSNIPLIAQYKKLLNNLKIETGRKE